MNSNNKKVQMDDKTAMAFAGYEFEQRHPKQSWPEWLVRCSTIGYNKDETGRFIMRFSITPLATNDAIPYFIVAIDSVTAEAEVLLDRDISDFSGEDLQGY